MTGLLTEKYLDKNAVDIVVEHPEVYTHKTCRTQTAMPAGVRANYIADPFFYRSGTICAKCGPVNDHDCIWIETGESVHRYMQRLKAEKSTAYHVVRAMLPVMLSAALALGVADVNLDKGENVAANDLVMWTLFGLVITWYPAKFIRLLLCRIGLI